MSEPKLVRIEIADHVGTLILADEPRLNAFGLSLADQAEQERLAQLDNSAHPDFAEGVKAFVAKRPPVFGG